MQFLICFNISLFFLILNVSFFKQISFSLSCPCMKISSQIVILSQTTFSDLVQKIPGRIRKDITYKSQWNSSRPAQCPYCLVFIKQARNMNRHIKYYCQNAGAPGKHYLRPQVELRVEEPPIQFNLPNNVSESKE